MRRVIYISGSHVANDPDALDAIVEAASMLNAAAGISGMLWSGLHEFVQALEVDYDQVGDTMKRIAADTRHGEIEIICDCTVQLWMFGAWSMIHSSRTGVAYTASPSRPFSSSLYQVAVPAKR